MKVPRPLPLYPPLDILKDVKPTDFPELINFLNSGPQWRQCMWQYGQAFLLYIGRNKSDHTFLRFRSEIEKFLLWCFLIKEESPVDFKKADILEYMDFAWAPPVQWVSLSNREKFLFKNGKYVANPSWAPFRLSKSQVGNEEADKSRYRPSQQSLQATFTGIVSFYRFLMDEDACPGNPAQLAKRDCKYLMNDSQIRSTKRLSEEQWQFLLECAASMADEDERFERNLFLVAALKTLFLRISELSERNDWVPSMGHFWEDDAGNWWLKVYGKGRKIRDVTVPTSFLDYLKRYRIYRGLPSLPDESESDAILAKIRGRGGLTARQLSRLVQAVFDKAYQEMLQMKGQQSASKFRIATAHWLRHTEGWQTNVKTSPKTLPTY